MFEFIYYSIVYSMATQTISKTLTNTHVALATGILLIAAGSAAFAAMGRPPEKLFSTMSVTCHDGSKMMMDQYIQTVYNGPDASPQAGPGHPCFTSRQAQIIANGFCQNKRNPSTGKTGVNTFSVKGRCEQAPEQNYGYIPVPNYGYGYGTPSYGYSSSRK